MLSSLNFWIGLAVGGAIGFALAVGAIAFFFGQATRTAAKPPYIDESLQMQRENLEATRETNRLLKQLLERRPSGSSPPRQ